MEIVLIIFCVFCFVMAIWKAFDNKKTKTNAPDYNYIKNEEEINELENIWEDDQKDKIAGDIIYSNIQKIQSLNNQFETENEPAVLENIKSNMENWIKSCIELEKYYPNVICKLKDSDEKLQRVKERYNERLYLIVKESLDNYRLKMTEQISEFKQDLETEIIFEKIQYYEGFIEKSAKNYKECLDSFNRFHNEVEDLFSELK